jgi:beta-aspartyl-dipeptidase (metallo-type)
MFQLVTNGDVYTPDPRGRVDVLMSFDRIVKVGRVDRKALDAIGAEVEVIDAARGFVVPGFLDPHEHLLGGSGEKGFATQTPEIALSEIACAGITSVVGCLGVDTTMKTMAGLLAKVKGMREEKLNAYIWSGGYNVPATSVLGSVREDIMFLDECIGAGEVAIADRRGTAPGAREMAKLVTDAFVGGMLGKKAGVTHFHVGELDERLAVLREMVERFEVDPSWYYITHVERSKELMREAIQLAAEGSTCDIDTVEGELHKWVRFWLDEGGDPSKLTISSDASKSSPMKFSKEVRGLVTDHGMTLDQVLPFVTTNTARVLKLDDLKGELAAGKAADLVVLDRDSLDVREVISLGRRLVVDGQMAIREQFLEGSDRRVSLTGEKFEPSSISAVR